MIISHHAKFTKKMPHLRQIFLYSLLIPTCPGMGEGESAFLPTYVFAFISGGNGGLMVSALASG